MSGRPKGAPYAALRATWWKEYRTLSWVAGAVFPDLLSYCADCQQGGRFDPPVLYQIAAGRPIDVDAVLAELEAARLIVKGRDGRWAIRKWDEHNAHLAAACARREADKAAKAARREEERRAKEAAEEALDAMSDGHPHDIGADMEPTSGGQAPISDGHPHDIPPDISGSGSDLPSSSASDASARAEIPAWLVAAKLYADRYESTRSLPYMQHALHRDSFESIAQAAEIVARRRGMTREAVIARALDGAFSDAWMRDADYPPQAIAKKFGACFAPPPKRGEMQPVAPHRDDIDDSPEAIEAAFSRKGKRL